MALLMSGWPVVGDAGDWAGPTPEVRELPEAIASAFRRPTTILKPDRDEAEWWAGAPSVVRDEQGTFWLAARMRSPEHPVGLRGYEIRLLKSADGLHFEKVRSIHRSELPIPGFERPALVLDPRTRRFKLYPVYNVLTGLGFTFDLEQVIDLSPEAPLFRSLTPGNRFFTWRYSHWLWVEAELWIYAEVANERQAHETRLFRLPRDPQAAMTRHR